MASISRPAKNNVKPAILSAVIRDPLLVHAISEHSKTTKTLTPWTSQNLRKAKNRFLISSKRTSRPIFLILISKKVLMRSDHANIATNSSTCIALFSLLINAKMPSRANETPYEMSVNLSVCLIYAGTNITMLLRTTNIKAKRYSFIAIL